MKTKSIYEIIKESIVDNELPRYFSLPRDSKEEIMFADGAQDGIYIYHMFPEEISDEDYNTMSKALLEASNRNFDSADRLFIELSKNVSCISIIDKLHKYIWDNKEDLKAGNIYEYAIGLITLSDNIECVKYGLSILEMLNTNNEELKRDIKILALSDEFTFYCVNIMRNWPQGNIDIFEAAKKVHGWGRIFAVEQLRALDPLYDEIRKWMLEEGIDNDISPAYSALTIWRNGNIGSTLYTNPTYEEFTYIRNIIDALLDEGPVQGLSALDKRKEIILTFLNEAKKMSLVIEDYEVIYNIYKYFEELKEPDVYLLAENILKSKESLLTISDNVNKTHNELIEFVGLNN